MTGLTPQLDLFPLTAAVLSTAACGLLGNFLVLRRLSLMGDAISHGVLPGLVIAMLVTASYSPAAVFAGAAIAGLVTVVLVELVKRVGRVDHGCDVGLIVGEGMDMSGHGIIEQALGQSLPAPVDHQ